MRLTSLVSAVAALAIAATAAAQSRQIPAAAQSRPVVIEHATIHTVSGDTIENGYVVFDGGVITDVGDGAAPRRRGAERIDAAGLHVYPGLISCSTTLGLTETGSVDVTQDHTEYGSVKAEVRAAVAINPDSDLIPVTRANGILTAMIMPNGGLVSGRSSLVRLDGWTWEDMAIDDAAGLVLSWPRTEPISSPWMRRSAAAQLGDIESQLEAIDDLFDAAEQYVIARENDDTVAPDLRYEGMRAVLTGAKPIYVRASSAGQIESAVAWAHRRGLDIVIVGGHGADEAIPILVQHDVPVIITGLHRMPSARHAAYDEPFTLPLRLHEAGVRFAIASGEGAAHERNLNHNVATAAAYGLSRDDALRAVTLSAAEVLGVGDTLGSIEKGKAATLIVTTGDPLEIMNDTLIAFIDGRRIDLGSRHKALYAKYQEKYRQLGLLDETEGTRAESEATERRGTKE